MVPGRRDLRAPLKPWDPRGSTLLFLARYPDPIPLPTRLKRLQSLRVSQMGLARISPVSTNTSSLPKVLCPPIVGSCSRTAVSNSSSRSNSCRSMTTCISSPERVVSSAPEMLHIGCVRKLDSCFPALSAPFGSSFSVQNHLIDGQEAQGTLLKRRDFLCS